MKVLVAYFSQSGNTQKIAQAIHKEASLKNEAALKKIEEITPATVLGYDIVFLGSPLHSGSLAAPVKECLGVLQASSGQKMVGFITHFAPAYPEQDMDAFTEPIKKTCQEKGIKYMGCFDCQGALAEAMHEPVQKKLALSNEQWTEIIEQMTGHPNENDIAKAQACVREVLG